MGVGKIALGIALKKESAHKLVGSRLFRNRRDQESGQEPRGLGEAAGQVSKLAIKELGPGRRYSRWQVFKQDISQKQPLPSKSTWKGSKGANNSDHSLLL